MESPRIAALNGGAFQCEASLVTTSIWFNKMIGRFASVVLCGTLAHISARPGTYSNTRFSIPSASKIFLKKAADRVSLPGGFVVSIRRYSCSHCRANSEYCFSRSPGTLLDARSWLDEPACDELSVIVSNQKIAVRQPNLWLLCIRFLA